MPLRTVLKIRGRSTPFSSILVHGNGVKTADVDPEELPQHFQQSDVHLDVLVTDIYGEGLVLHLSCNVDRYQHQRRIPGLFALFGLVPAQEAKPQIYRVGTVFLDADLCLTVELLHGLFQVSLL